MIIYHTTFHLSHDAYLRGVDYLKTTYIPNAVRSGKLHTPRMMRVLNEDSDVNGVSLSIQFHVEDTDILDEWISKEGVTLQKALTEKFNDEIAGFSTLLEEVEL